MNNGHNGYIKIGDRVQIADVFNERHGLYGTIILCMENGGVVKLDQPIDPQRPFTVVLNNHLKLI